jgi:hypothetical protein
MLTGTDTPLLYLDYGADAQRCEFGDIAVSERGMRFTSRWQFSIGTQLSVLLTHMHPRLGLCRMTIEGIVVWCEPKADKGHESTLLFLELPDELKPSLREFSHQLAPV